jgi:hypothetical protein
MKYDPGLEIVNLSHLEFGNMKVEVSHKDSKKMIALETALAAEKIEYQFIVGDGKAKDKIVFKRIIWPRLNFALFQAGLLKLETNKAET